MVKASYKANLDGLKNLNKAFEDKIQTKVGILAGNNKRNPDADEQDPPTNAQLGLTHEVGSFTRGIPARSWLRMPLQYKSKEIQNFIFKRSKAISEDMADGSLQQLYEHLGITAIGFIQTAFETRGWGQWKPNAPSTVRQKGSDAPLIDSSQLREAVTYEVKK